MPDTDLSISRFSFGTANLHHIGGRKKQTAHLMSAADVGFSHFDTAPLYGFGEAERALGIAFGGLENITIATKVGLYPPGGSDQGRASMFARKVAGKVICPLSRAIVDLSVKRASLSVEGSLKRLRRTRLDLLLLHEANINLLNSDEWQRWQENFRDKVRWIGVAGPAATVEPFLKSQSPIAQIVQVRDGLTTHEADVVGAAGRSLQLTYGYFSSGAVQNLGEDVLREALLRNSTGSVLVTTRQTHRLATFARIANGSIGREVS
ncbi:aldo/keto reductase [Haliea sp. E1-2-M8]|nr:aldo/keto reductase [Haliea sp. E1-2-M8]